MADETVGGRLRAIRKARGVTLAKAGEACGCDPSNVAHVESDKHRLNLDMIRALAELYACSIEELVAVGAPLPQAGVGEPSKSEAA
jgi:transcriptional regulator with XRE-family HTH domain